MRRLGIFTFIAGLAALTGIGFIGSGVAATHGPAAGPSGQGDPAKGSNPEHMLIMPMMIPARGRKLFASKGCVVCHSVNGVGGEDAPPLDAATMPVVMNPFDFAAKMWRGAAAMISVQEDELGEQIEFTGSELANIIAFVHSAEEQEKFTKADIPPRISALMRRMDEKENGAGKPKK
ncbi:cytochrome c [bacterium BMS3Bbin10]|nr:cytochrome c [bacterium BMS3Bbin10]